MRVLAFFLISFCLVLSWLPCASLANQDSEAGVTVLIYHHFGRSEYPETNVSVTRFAEQMEYLQKEGYRVISLQELVKSLRGGEFPERAVVITIDDGYRTIYDKAWPILRSHGFPFTVFLYVEGIDKGYSNYLTWDQVRQMQKAGVDFQDHTFSHHRLGTMPAGMDEAGYRNWIREDLTRGAERLASVLGVKPNILALPYGEYNSIVLEEAKAIGYEAICTQDAGSVSRDTDRFLISREPILGNDWSTMAHFKNVLERVDLPFTEMEPSFAPAGKQTVKRFGARLLYPERYLPESLGIYVSELGWQPATLKGDLLFIANDKPLTRRQNRIAVSGRERETGKTAIRFWLHLQGD